LALVAIPAAANAGGSKCFGERPTIVADASARVVDGTKGADGGEGIDGCSGESMTSCERDARTPRLLPAFGL
jgi:hypothetical protein